MTVAEARALIAKAPIAQDRLQHWLDLGCGTGTFTLALAELLPTGSAITAVDLDPGSLRSLPTEHQGVRIRTQVADVARMELPPVDGVLMANVLHFIADQHTMLTRLGQATTQVLLVEYDRTDPLPPWVPYPVPMRRSAGLFRDAGFPRAEQLGSRPSRYGGGPLYAAAFLSGIG